MFKVGDFAVYPAHGVGIIKAIEKREISGCYQSFYIMKILDNGMTIMIPIDSADSVGLRNIISQSEVPKVFEILKTKELKINGHSWNQRYREYMGRIKTGSIFEIAEVLRDLQLLKTQKELSFGERKMLDMVTSLVVKELAIAEKVQENVIGEEINKIFNNRSS
ncbi:MAG: CarD family transcriptional regulator [Deltaproteobacteria bacterium]|nr:CarD family transcriptional regulator [Deltaproteobacteria bacterium]